MKLKRIPEDFEVEESTDLKPQASGEFALYRLTKEGIGTIEAVDAVSRRWNIAPARISFGGLKDRHARTRQHVTIHGGPRKDLQQSSLDLRYLGQVPRPFTAKDVAGNRFGVVLRSLSAPEEAAALAALPEAVRDGLPNYFDDQRFGSLGVSGEWIARPWIAGEYERTLFLALAEPNEMDRPRVRDEKELLRSAWGDWGLLASRARGPAREVAAFLAARPGDFKGALGRVRPEWRSLWLAAFQSYLYNRVLSAAMTEVVAPDRLVTVDLKSGPVAFPRALSDEERERLGGLTLPLPSSRVRLEDGFAKDVTERTLAALSLTLRDVNVKAPRGSFFSKGFRPAMFHLLEPSHESEDDEMYPGRRKLTLRFGLPRGTYATILVKRLTVAAGG